MVSCAGGQRPSRCRRSVALPSCFEVCFLKNASRTSLAERESSRLSGRRVLSIQEESLSSFLKVIVPFALTLKVSCFLEVPKCLSLLCPPGVCNSQISLSFFAFSGWRQLCSQQIKSVARVRFQPGEKIPRVPQKGGAPSFLQHPPCPCPAAPGPAAPLPVAPSASQVLRLWWAAVLMGLCRPGPSLPGCLLQPLPPSVPLHLLEKFPFSLALEHQRASSWAAEMPGNNHSSIPGALGRKNEEVVSQCGRCLGHSLILCAAGRGVPKGTTPPRSGGSVGEGSEHPRLPQGRAMAGATGG